VNKKQETLKAQFTRYNLLSNRFDNLFSNRFDNIVYTNIQPVVEPVSQPVSQPVCRPQGRAKVANWRYFPSLPTLIHQMESPNDIIIQTKLTLTLTLTVTLILILVNPNILRTLFTLLRAEWCGRQQ